MKLAPYMCTAACSVGMMLFPQDIFAVCQGVSGSWSDNNSYSWHLTQSGTSISGTMDGDCTGWSVSGSIDNSGSFSVTASGSGCPASSFTYSGTIQGVGCDSGSGSWSNNVGDSGSWNWSKSCDKPDSEAHSGLYWADEIGGDPTAYVWGALLQSNSGLVFGDRTVAESDGGGGSDGCYFDGSIYGPFTTVPNKSGPVRWDQTYSDQVGATTTLTNYYRQERPARGLSLPCSFRYHQNMGIACSDSTSLQYAQNDLEADIDVTTVSSCRSFAGMLPTCETRTW
jgi:hypothetical protein